MTVKIDISKSLAVNTLFAACLAAALQFSAAAQTASGKSVNLSGTWELHFDSMNVPPAALAPARAPRIFTSPSGAARK